MSTVLCNFFENISWNKSSESFTLKNEIDIWRIPVASDPGSFRHFESFLQPDELDRASRFHQEKDRLRFICSRALLRILLAKYLARSPKEIQLAIGINKKPFVQNTGDIDLHYNIAHAGDWILIAVSDLAVGVDVEKIDDQFSYAEILRFNFSPREIQYVENASEPRTSFYTCWTRKEALSKATARGLDDKLPSVPCLDGLHESDPEITGNNKSWLISSFKVEEKYIGSVAYDPETQNVRFWHAADWHK